MISEVVQNVGIVAAGQRIADLQVAAAGRGVITIDQGISELFAHLVR